MKFLRRKSKRSSRIDLTELIIKFTLLYTMHVILRQKGKELNIEEFDRINELSISELEKYLEFCIQREDYEQCAKIRDLINKKNHKQ